MLKPKVPQVIAHWSVLLEDFNTSGMAFFDQVEAALREREVPETSFSLVRWKEGGFGSAEREYLRVERGRLAYDICAAPFGRGFFFSSWLTLPGAKHPWLWFLGFLLLFALWCSVLFDSATTALQRSMLMGESGGAGTLFWLTLLGLPLVLFGLGLAIHKGQLDIAEEDVLAIPILGWLYFILFNPITFYRIDTALMFQKSVHNAVTEVIDSLRSEQGLRVLSEIERRPTIREFMR